MSKVPKHKHNWQYELDNLICHWFPGPVGIVCPRHKFHRWSNGSTETDMIDLRGRDGSGSRSAGCGNGLRSKCGADWKMQCWPQLSQTFSINFIDNKIHIKNKIEISLYINRWPLFDLTFSWCHPPWPKPRPSTLWRRLQLPTTDVAPPEWECTDRK